MSNSPIPSDVYDELVAAIVKAVPCEHHFLTDNRVLEAQGGDKCMNCGLWESEAVQKPCVKLGCMMTLEDVLMTFGSSRVFVSFGGLVAVFWKNRKAYDCYCGPSDKGRLFDWALGRDLAWHRDNAPDTIRSLHALLHQAERAQA